VQCESIFFCSRTPSPDISTDADGRKFSLDELWTLSDTIKRTVRYYMQIGLVDPPIGATKAAHYLHRHLEQLLTVRKLSDAGVSLERIREVLSGEVPPVPPRQRQPGSVEVRSHLFITEGIELEISPEQAGLNPEQVRKLVRAIMKTYQDLQGKNRMNAVTQPELSQLMSPEGLAATLQSVQVDGQLDGLLLRMTTRQSYKSRREGQLSCSN